VKEGIFIGPLIQEVMQDPGFRSTLSDTEKAAWNAFKSVCTNFLGNHRAKNYREIVSEMLKCFQVMKCNMSLKLHLLDAYLDFFQKKTREKLVMNTVKDFTKTFPSWRNGSWEDKNCGMLAEYCWPIVRETPDSDYIRKRSRKTF
jgi:hypothetical protein